MSNTPVQPTGSMPALNSSPTGAVSSTATTTSSIPDTVTPVVSSTTTSTTSSTPTQPPTPTKKKIKPQFLFGILALFILIVGAGVGFVLMNQSAEIRQQAAGYASCAGGVPHDAKTCSGFRQPVRCNNGSFVTLAACASDEFCDSSQNGACVKTARSCAGGVPDGGKACSGLREVVTCRDGSFVNPTACPTGQTCSGGVCSTGGSVTNCGRSGPNTTQCTDKNVGTSCRTISNVAGTCQVTIPGGANSECECRTGAVASPLPSPTPGGACQPLTAACSDTSPCCDGGVCQGVGGNRRCEQQVVGQCGTGVCGGTNGWLGFRCNNLTNGQCLENPQTFSSYGAAAAYAGGCGQVDEVCVGGDYNRNLCGAFHIISTTCGGSVASPTPRPTPSPTPRPTPSPGATPSPDPSPSPSPQVSPSPSPAPICAYVALNKRSVKVGDQVNLTCGMVAGATSYEFRVKLPDGTVVPILASSANSNISSDFPITQTGSHKAQCRICTGGPNSCHEWETL